MSANDISDSLIQEVMACAEMPSQWSEQSTVEDAAADHSTAADHSIAVAANAGPHYQKLYARVTHIWGNRKGQPDQSAMKGPRLERTASLITVPLASGKFFCV